MGDDTIRNMPDDQLVSQVENDWPEAKQALDQTEWADTPIGRETIERLDTCLLQVTTRFKTFASQKQPA